jgi:hypothetical protein
MGTYYVRPLGNHEYALSMQFKSRQEPQPKINVEYVASIVEELQDGSSHVTVIVRVTPTLSEDLK